jgi:putative phosphoesterase
VAFRDGRFRFAAIADTHSKPHPDTERRLSELRPDAILHGGDIGNLSVLDQVGKIAPVFAVRGNIDGRTNDVPDLLAIDVMEGTTLELRLLLVHIAVYGPKIRADVARIARREGASLVVCGHSHVPFMGRDKGLTVFNPGSVGPRRFALPIVLGSVDVAHRDVRLRHIDCETGETWSPPTFAKPVPV